MFSVCRNTTTENYLRCLEHHLVKFQMTTLPISPAGSRDCWFIVTMLWGSAAKRLHFSLIMIMSRFINPFRRLCLRQVGRYKLGQAGLRAKLRRVSRKWNLLVGFGSNHHVGLGAELQKLFRKEKEIFSLGLWSNHRASWRKDLRKSSKRGKGMLFKQPFMFNSVCFAGNVVIWKQTSLACDSWNQFMDSPGQSLSP